MKQVVSLILVLTVSTWSQAAPISEVVRKRLAMGDKTNRLINEKSPYLLQHAFNPVDWYPWGDEPFARAKTEDKPIFLSVGYSTCHWCHVMERESFENPEIAALLNKWFVCIKVDREERPDIDQLYMAATQAMTGSGGWPMSVFLLPDGKPFYAGTYFPPRSQYGRPGFADVLNTIHDAWQNKRLDLTNIAAQLVSELEKKAQSSQTAIISKNILEKAYNAFSKDFEPTYGGFSYAPKFPRPVQFNFLLGYWHATGEKKALEMVTSTLSHMAEGGIYDHVGGGFHRYATDPHWRVPHFEKMLYDQAQLVSSYLDAYIITDKQQFGEVASQVLDYVLRDMTSPEGGFYSAEDADSEDPYKPGTSGEGAFYLWTEKEIKKILSPEELGIFSYIYGVKPEGNAPEDPQDEFVGRNILYRAHDIKDAGTKFKISPDEIVRVLEGSRQKLLVQRSLRERPHLDDKILVSWNGLMIGAFARGGIILEEPRYIEAAVKAAAFIQEVMYSRKAGTGAKGQKLMRRYREGESGLAAQLDDYAFLAAGLLELYQATQNPDLLRWAVELTETQISVFWDKEKGGFYDSVADSTLPFRMKGDYDGAEPAANSVAAMNLFKLSSVTANKKWAEMVRTNIDAFSSALNRYPQALPQMLTVLQLSTNKPGQVVIAGSAGDSGVQKMVLAVYKSYDPGRFVLLADNSVNQQFLAEKIPFIEGMGMVNRRATAYVCQDFTCQIPVTDTEALLKQLDPEKKLPQQNN